MDSHDIFQCCIALIEEMQKKRYSNKNCIEIDEMLSEVKYGGGADDDDGGKLFQKFKKNYFSLYRGILSKFVNERNITILVQMLKQRDEIENGNIELVDASQNIANVLSNEYNVNWPKFLEKCEKEKKIR